MITFNSKRRNANVGQKKSLKLQTKEMFCAFKGFFFFAFVCQAGRDTKMLKQQEEEGKQKTFSYSMLNSFLEMNSVFILLKSL